MQNDSLYPYVLDPKLTTQVWGGDELVRVYGKHGDPQARLGESWECWDTDRVLNGSLAGTTSPICACAWVPSCWGTSIPNASFRC